MWIWSICRGIKNYELRIFLKKLITVIGGGISGITTAVTLQLLGYETVCCAEHLVDEDAPDDPRFASLYPAASVIPHSVRSNHLNTLFPDSLVVFETLLSAEFPGLVKHRHYEIFKFPVEAPEYTSFLKNFTPVKNLPRSEIPRRSDATDLYGWAFNCFIAEWPAYIHHLYKLYEKAGGTIQKRKIARGDIEKLSSSIIINCGGIWSSELFEDTEEAKVTRGHIVHIFDKAKVKNAKGNVCSYNYTPLPSVYTTPGGDPCDVYFYPVGEKWILGGSREAGLLENGIWSGKECRSTINLDKLVVPKQIVGLNGEILENTYQAKLQPNEKMKSFIGYRFERNDPENGLRLEAVKEFGKTIIHNYGHGGAGVTLSWGCALKVAELVEEDSPESEKLLSDLLNKLKIQD